MWGNWRSECTMETLFSLLTQIFITRTRWYIQLLLPVLWNQWMKQTKSSNKLWHQKRSRVCRNLRTCKEAYTSTLWVPRQKRKLVIYPTNFLFACKPRRYKEVRSRILETHVLATNDADETDGTGTNSAQGCESMFQKGQVLSIKHIRRRELWGFFN